MVTDNRGERLIPKEDQDQEPEDEYAWHFAGTVRRPASLQQSNPGTFAEEDVRGYRGGVTNGLMDQL